MSIYNSIKDNSAVVASTRMDTGNVAARKAYHVGAHIAVVERSREEKIVAEDVAVRPERHLHQPGEGKKHQRQQRDLADIPEHAAVAVEPMPGSRARFLPRNGRLRVSLLLHKRPRSA